mmetsp:Transcript_39198/g.100428  ORF Transcript_39198/g.100428 Transcript_39198/m.100428 type:complete len:225 (+) Transcript_39198:242-916(+)
MRSRSSSCRGRGERVRQSSTIEGSPPATASSTATLSALLSMCRRRSGRVGGRAAICDRSVSNLPTISSSLSTYFAYLGREQSGAPLLDSVSRSSTSMSFPADLITRLIILVRSFGRSLGRVTHIAPLFSIVKNSSSLLSSVLNVRRKKQDGGSTASIHFKNPVRTGLSPSPSPPAPSAREKAEHPSTTIPSITVSGSSSMRSSTMLLPSPTVLGFLLPSPPALE